MPFISSSRHAVFAFLFILLVSISGCSMLDPHKVPVQQGNVLQTTHIQQLAIGMQPQQILKLLGSPLIQDSFHNNRWDYVYSLRDSHGALTHYHLKLQFEKNRLTSWHSTLS
jgi:outer membrane protein assembly factor BamE